MMIDFALEAEREQGKSPEEAIYQACLLRFRPIMMTTMAALLGALPLALGTGPGSELRRPLGHRDRRRAAGLAVPDAVHHAGDLPLPGPAGAPVRGAAARADGTRRRSPGTRRRRCVNISAPVHPAAGRHLAARGRRCCSSGSSRTRCCRSRRCRKVDFPTIPVSATLPGREPGDDGRLGGGAARAPASGRSPGVTEMTSVQRARQHHVTLQFDLDRNIDGAARDVQAAINAAGGELPANLPHAARPTGRSNPADAPIMILALTSTTLPPRQRLRRRRPGARAADRAGRRRQPGQRRRRAEAGGARPGRIRRALAALGLALEDVRTALAGDQRQRAQGQRRRRRRSLRRSTANDQLHRRRRTTGR